MGRGRILAWLALFCLSAFLLCHGVEGADVRADAGGDSPSAGGGQMWGADGYEPSAVQLGDEEEEEEEERHYALEDTGHGRLSEEQLLEEERAYFHTRDHDGDGFLNKEEFLRELQGEILHVFEAERQQLMADQEMTQSMGGDGNDPDDLDEDGLPYAEIPDDSLEGLSEEERKKRGIPNEDGTMPGHKEYEVEDETLGEEEMKAEAELQRKLQEEDSMKPKFERPPSYTHERKHPLPSNNALLYGKDWTARVPLHEGEDAFARFDTNQDEKIDWNEWKSQMFHEEPQRAQYKDGQKIRVYDPSGLGDEDVNPEDIQQMEEMFKEFDTDKDEYILESDILKMLIKHRDEPMYPDSVENWEKPTDEALAESAREMMTGYDTNKDKKLTLKEWMTGGGF